MLLAATRGWGRVAMLIDTAGPSSEVALEPRPDVRLVSSFVVFVCGASCMG